MAVNKPALESLLGSFFANLPPGNDPGSARSTCAALWAASMQAYAMSVTPPSTQVVTAAVNLRAQLVSAFNGNIDQILVNMETAFSVFATMVALGMTGGVPAPPPGPVGFADLNSPASTPYEAATNWANKIHAWFITGTLTPPSGPVVNWS